MKGFRLAWLSVSQEMIVDPSCIRIVHNTEVKRVFMEVFVTVLDVTKYDFRSVYLYTGPACSQWDQIHYAAKSETSMFSEEWFRKFSEKWFAN